MQSYRLERRSLVRFSGDEAGDFLNDLITADTSAIEANTVQHGMLLTPQGRILYDLLISRDGDDFLLEVDAERQGDFIKKMMMYRLRRPVQITPDDQSVYALVNTNANANDQNAGLADPRFNGAVMRYYGTRDDAIGTDRGYQALRYQYGVAEGAIDLPPEKALPLEARLDLDQGISFEKGCYIGQEVTARTRYRGLVKRSYLPVRFDSADDDYNWDLPQDITLDDRVVGQVLGMAKDDDGVIGLASIRLEAINAVIENTGNLAIGNATLTPIYPERLMPLPAKKD